MIEQLSISTLPLNTPQPTAQNTVNEVALFGESMARAESVQSGSALESIKGAIQPLDYINTEAKEIFSYAKDAVASGNDLTPSEIVMLTARSQEFMFHCQLTANVANRTSDGIQQLFRQQS